jgi:uncharacterized protein YbjT (DUF2867 family)
MSNKPIILITNATGNTAAAVIRQIITKNESGSAIIRIGGPFQDYKKLKQFEAINNVEIVDLDLKSKESVRKALQVSKY